MSTALLPPVPACFAHVLSLLGKKGRGNTLRDLGSAYLLSIELDTDTPDAEMIAELAEKLGITTNDLEAPCPR